MPITLRKPELDSRVQAIADGQPTRVSKHAMAEAMLGAVCAACEQTGNPEAWREIGNAASNGSAGAQQNGTGRSVDSVSNQPNTSRPAISKRGNDSRDSTTAEPRANAA